MMSYNYIIIQLNEPPTTTPKSTRRLKAAATARPTKAWRSGSSKRNNYNASNEALSNFTQVLIFNITINEDTFK